MFKKINVTKIKQAIIPKAPKKTAPIKTTQQHSGGKAEQLAQAFLERQNLQFIIKNYYCRRGEIDLIFKDNDALVFIEVRYRRQIYFGSACETIDNTKQKKLIKAAEHYLHSHQLTESMASRFDVIGITPNTKSVTKSPCEAQNTSSIIKDKNNNEYRIEWIKNAFQRF